jgi:cytoskeleton protein RodZ
MTKQQAELISTRPGARLRHEREARGLTIEQIAARTRVRERIVQAIERDDTDWIAPVYLRGYVRAYAQGLGLNPEELEAEARATSGSDPELQSVFKVDRKRGFAERWLKAGSYLVATALIAALVWQVTQQAVQFSEGHRQVVDTSQSAPEVNKPVNAPERPSGRGSQNTHLAASIASLEKLQGRQPESAAAAEQAWSAINQPQTGLSGIDIRVSADSWVEIRDSSGEQLEMDLLRGGNERHYTGKPPFELMLGRASAVELQFEGEPVDLAPHIRGDVARLTLGAKDQETP